MTRDGNLTGGILLAAFTAGPIFVLAMTLGLYCSAIPSAVKVTPIMVLVLTFGMIPAMVIGLIVSIIPILVGSFALAAIGDRIPALRAAPVWIATGAAAPFVLLIMSGFGPDDDPALFAFTATGAVCAGLCRRSIRWPRPQPSGLWQTASILLPSGSSTKAP